MPISLGPAKLQRTSHTILHYYSLDPLLEEINDLQKQYHTLLANLKDKPSFLRELGNYNKIILHLQELISSKLSNIHNTFSFTRTKRGLYDNLGSLIKLTTGNLDSSDGERFNQILQDLNNKDKIMQNQIELQYSLTQEAIKRFDKSIKDIEHNEEVLKFRIKEIVNITDKEIRIKDNILAKDIFSQLIFLSNSILSILQDLENALTFCKLKTYHPSILKPDDLTSHLDKLKQTRKISPDDFNIFELQKLIEVNCKVERNRISFFLSFPVNYDTTFELVHLLSIPSFNGHEYFTIIPSNKYYLKSRNIMKALNGPCILGKPHQCLQENLKVNENICEREIVLLESTKSCEHVKLEIKENLFEFISDINQYLAVFPNKEILRIESLDHNEIKELQGVFLVEPSKGQLYFRDNVVHFQSKSVGKPTLLSPSEVTNNRSTHYSNIKLQLQNLDFSNINPNYISTSEILGGKENTFWNYLGIITFGLCCLYLVLQGVKGFSISLLKPSTLTVETVETGSVNIELPSVAPNSPRLYPDISPLGNARI